MRDALALRLLRTGPGLAGMLLLALGVALALSAPLLFPGDPLDMVARPLTPPFANPAAPLGTDRLGRNILAGLAHGARATIATAGLVALVALGVGAAIGTVAGYAGGLVDEALMRVADATQTVPGFVLALALVSVLGPTQPAIVLALAAGAWTGPARVVRAETLSLKERAFVEASRLVGRRPLAIAFDVVLPNALNPLIALAAVIVAGAILAESALAFLGLGDPNVASWGAMIAEGRAVLRTAPHVILAPGLAVMATVLAVSLVGDGLARTLASSDG
ncbi:MAG TPA: ABC transporter permease [Microvirga sp.]|jgi:peptide/nickel transport system permease protein|nr:ABC transporter permease [Microvirga sp.]